MWKRREFLMFMGATGLVGCSNLKSANLRRNSSSPAVLHAGLEDQFRCLDGFDHEVLISWGDQLNTKPETFGFNNDFICFTPISRTEAWLWVNHEYPDSLFIHGKSKPESMADVEKEQESLGGSILKIKYENSSWRWIPNDPGNRRIDAKTPIPLVSDRPIAGSRTAIGTFGNCGGGQTPWGSILSCEENYDEYYGDRASESEKLPTQSDRHWASFIQRPPEHYGWVLEINPHTAQAKKLTALGRFAHESATLTQASDGRCVVYMGDDAADECLYKFISDRPGSLESGKLYVASLEKSKWLPLDVGQSRVLKENFEDQTDVFIHTRRAAHLIGGTPLHRPEDIKIHPQTKDVYVALTNHTKKNDWYGSILRIREEGSDPLSLKFSSETFITGGEHSGFACPDNLCFDAYGNLWMTTDMSASAIGKAPYKAFGNNSLFFIPLNGDRAGEVIRVASGPVGSELTGPCFSPSGDQLFLSVQHPGEKSTSLANPTSRWPAGGATLPKPSVVVLSLPKDGFFRNA